MQPDDQVVRYFQNAPHTRLLPIYSLCFPLESLLYNDTAHPVLTDQKIR